MHGLACGRWLLSHAHDAVLVQQWCADHYQWRQQVCRQVYRQWCSPSIGRCKSEVATVAAEPCLLHWTDGPNVQQAVVTCPQLAKAT